jgi:sugar O-acyltransferase (sialic acid O-acetyltransferase NeuD family)
MHQAPQEFSSFVIFGGGQHAYLINALANKQGLKIIGWIDKSAVSKFKSSKDFLHFTHDSDYLDLRAKGVGMLPGIASHKLWARRRDLIEEFSSNSYITPKILDGNASISDNVHLGQGVQILGNCFIQSFVEIGNWSVINSGSTVEHDAVIGDSVHIAPGVTICGGVSIGAGSYVGAGSTVIEGVTIGENVLIGAGSLVLKDVPGNEIHFGTPSTYKGSNHE